MRRTHLRGHQKIPKRLIIHVCGFSLVKVMRRIFGFGKLKSFQEPDFAPILDSMAVLFRRIVCLRELYRSWSHFFPQETIFDVLKPVRAA